MPVQLVGATPIALSAPSIPVSLTLTGVTLPPPSIPASLVGTLPPIPMPTQFTTPISISQPTSLPTIQGVASSISLPAGIPNPISISIPLVSSSSSNPASLTISAAKILTPPATSASTVPASSEQKLKPNPTIPVSVPSGITPAASISQVIPSTSASSTAPSFSTSTATTATSAPTASSGAAFFEIQYQFGSGLEMRHTSKRLIEVFKEESEKEKKRQEIKRQNLDTSVLLEAASSIARQFRTSFNDVVQQHKATFLLAGKTGVGKSSVANKVFGHQIAQVGKGVSITSHCMKYETPGKPLVLYDTKGFEVDTVKEFVEEIERFFIEHSTSDCLHAVWYVVDGTTSRFEPFEQEFCRTILSKLPYLILVNKADACKSDIHQLISVIENLNLPNCRGVLPVIADSTHTLPDLEGARCPRCGSDDVSILRKRNELRCNGCEYTQDLESLTPPDGMQAVVELSMKTVPERVREALVATQKVSLQLKITMSKKIITEHFLSPKEGNKEKVLRKAVNMLARLCSIWDVESVSGRYGLAEKIVCLMNTTNPVSPAPNPTTSSTVAPPNPAIPTAAGAFTSASVGPSASLATPPPVTAIGTVTPRDVPLLLSGATSSASNVAGGDSWGTLWGTLFLDRLVNFLDSATAGASGEAEATRLHTTALGLAWVVSLLRLHISITLVGNQSEEADFIKECIDVAFANFSEECLCDYKDMIVSTRKVEIERMEKEEERKKEEKETGEGEDEGEGEGEVIVADADVADADAADDDGEVIVVGEEEGADVVVFPVAVSLSVLLCFASLFSVSTVRSLFSLGGMFIL
eukprot:TRINITY_DN827_c0_g1_i22.p1 TRINITY_DN827_c0_g1~~TRINITY_DN827_c0_g1_i22.p1  ORF type:complete len:811 (-),score=216.81 TRINITY_DN827_c0_g1_i22:25-2457(-)